jgi:hypothetical protein
MWAGRWSKTENRKWKMEIGKSPEWLAGDFAFWGMTRFASR